MVFLLWMCVVQCFSCVDIVRTVMANGNMIGSWWLHHQGYWRNGCQTCCNSFCSYWFCCFYCLYFGEYRGLLQLCYTGISPGITAAQHSTAVSPCPTAHLLLSQITWKFKPILFCKYLLQGEMCMQRDSNLLCMRSKLSTEQGKWIGTLAWPAEIQIIQTTKKKTAKHFVQFLEEKC